MAGNTFYAQKSANQRNSLLMAGFVVLLLGLLGFSVGYAIFGSPAGGVAMTLFALALGRHVGDRDVLPGRQARPGGERREGRGSGRRPAADERRPGARDRREHPGAGGLHHRRHGAERLRDRARPGPRLDRHHDRPAARSSTARSSRASSATSCRTCATWTSGSRWSSRSWSGPSPCWPTSSCGSRSGAASRPVAQRTAAGGGGAQAAFAIIAIALAILAPIISRFIQLSVSRQREYLADASSVELTRNPVGLERALAKISSDREVLEVANRGTQHLYFTNPIKKFEERSSSLMSTHPPILDRINRLRELTSQPPLCAEEAAHLADLE